jgi:hypothetical protein
LLNLMLVILLIQWIKPDHLIVEIQLSLLTKN